MAHEICKLGGRGGSTCNNKFFLFIYWFLLYNLIGYEEKDQGGKFKGNAGKYHYH